MGAGFEEWGGFAAARRRAAPIRRRLDGVEAPSGRIDGFAVHRADRLVDPFASPRDPWAG